MAMVLGACAARDPYVSSGGTRQSGSWQIEQQADRITGVPTPYAMAIAPESSNSYAEKPAPAGLHLTCFDGKPLVRFAFDFKVGSETNSVLGYRFDDKPGHDNVNVRFLQLYKTVVIEDRAEVIRFAGELAGSRTLVVRIRSINAGRTVAEFPIDGASAAIDAGFAGCSLTEPQPPEKKRGAKA
jgi:hypothetical protein